MVYMVCGCQCPWCHTCSAHVQALAEGAGSVPVTVKCRIGVDDVDDYASLHAFVSTVASKSPVRHFIVHSRKCLLNGLSPHQNRNIPPLRYSWVYALKRDFPDLAFSINGGIQSAQEAAEILAYRGSGGEAVHGVMIGRAAYHAPWTTLAQADTLLFGAERNGATCRRQVHHLLKSDAVVKSTCHVPASLT
jgi:tRNA-dihydrouridine synthase A